MEKELTSVLIKPVGPTCNMACTYCFYTKKTKMFRRNQEMKMSEDTLKKLIKNIARSTAGNISLGWQGGEPTLWGMDLFNKAITLEKRCTGEKRFSHGLQTNGLLLDREWTRFLIRNDFLVGLSMDGPRHIHNKYRLLKNGKGSFDLVLDRLKLLLDTGVTVNILAVVNDYSVQFPDEIYHFFKSTGVRHMQFIPCVEPGLEGDIAPFSLNPERFGEFLVTLLQLWKNDFKDGEPTTFIRFFDSLFFKYVHLDPPDCIFTENCGTYLVIEHNGDVYPCDFFVDPALKLGNIRQDDLYSLLNSTRQENFGKRKSSLSVLCRQCSWVAFCRGGCIKDRLIRDRQGIGLSYLCAAYRYFYPRADPFFKRLAENWKKNNDPGLR